ncbi:MAG TPA: hypothetical protein VJN90_13365 [Candidatus Acidoferrales bacterium]|nr:hypothetical protein [Candidatus Acidoferrales bacterium]
MSDSGTGLDIRWPIGLLFLAIGAAVAIYGIFSASRTDLWGLHINMNLGWGLIMTAFGLGMIWGGARAGRVS